MQGINVNRSDNVWEWSWLDKQVQEVLSGVFSSIKSEHGMVSSV